ncbi:MAG: hypothetical protein EB832_02900 [Thaumarchaeota archaeon S14]|nr:MAG: hypothetical protein EB832_02900 [Thaumarchaeota archaeon S14]
MATAGSGRGAAIDGSSETRPAAAGAMTAIETGIAKATRTTMPTPRPYRTPFRRRERLTPKALYRTTPTTMPITVATSMWNAKPAAGSPEPMIRAMTRSVRR